MHIARAYCAEAGKVVDIYQARALFFAQDEPRHRFEFLCSDDACRAANATRVTGVNYDKLVEDERDRVVVKPHFRMNPETPHDAACEWVARERAVEALGCSDAEPDGRGRTHHFQHWKHSDLVDIFMPSLPETTSMSPVPPEPPPPAPAAREPSGSGRDDELCRRGRSNPTRADFLETVVSAYELLEPEERREAALRIGRGPELSYSKAFCRIEHYFAARPARIFHGGVQVRLHGPNFAVRFFDRVVRAGETGRDNPLEVSLYLKRDALLRHWNGKFLLAQLTEASKRGHYAHCYFYGRLVEHLKVIDRVVVEVKGLEHLAFTVRKRAPTSSPDPARPDVT
jgi:hypothetical protein